MQPYFNLELFLATAEESRIEGDTLEECLALWADWSGHLACREVAVEDRRFLAVWLDETVENAVDAAWRGSPSRGFRLNALAQTLCMCAVHDRIPEVENAGCAPLPPPSAVLAQALAEAGLPAKSEKHLVLGRRYAVVTRSPFGGGCEICALRASCPRSGKHSGSVIELG